MTACFPISVEEYLDAYAVAAADPWAADQMAFYENAGPPPSPEEFAMEACWVVLNSGFRNTIARKVWRELRPAIPRGDAAMVFGNAKKVRAMNALWANRVELHGECLTKLAEGLESFITWCRKLDGFGAIIPYHLAKNFGLPTAKKDVWLERLAENGGEDAQDMCRRLSLASGHKVGTVDFVWWFVLARGHLVLGPEGRTWTIAIPSIHGMPAPGEGNGHRRCGLCGAADWINVIPLERLEQVGMLQAEDRHLLGQGWVQCVCASCKAKVDTTAAEDRQ